MLTISSYIKLIVALILGAIISQALGCSGLRTELLTVKREIKLPADDELATVKPVKRSLNGANLFVDARSRYYDSDSSKVSVDSSSPAPQAVENPRWLAEIKNYAEINDRNQVILNADSSMRIAEINRPDYQSAYEKIYVASIAVNEQSIAESPETDDKDTVEIGSGLVVAKASKVLERESLGKKIRNFAKKFASKMDDSNGVASELALESIEPVLKNHDLGSEAMLTENERALLGELRRLEESRYNLFTEINVGDTQQLSSNIEAFDGYLGLLRDLQLYRNAADEIDLKSQLIGSGTTHDDLVIRSGIENQLSRSRQKLTKIQNDLQRKIESFVQTTLALPPELNVKLNSDPISALKLLDPVSLEIDVLLESQKSSVLSAIQSDQFDRVQAATAVTEIHAAIEELIAENLSATKALPAESDSARKALATKLNALTKSLTEQKQVLQSLQKAKPKVALSSVELPLAEQAINQQYGADIDGASLIESIEVLQSVASELYAITGSINLQKIIVSSLDVEPQVAIAAAERNRHDLKRLESELHSAWSELNEAKADTADESNSKTVEAMVNYQRARRGVIQFRDQMNGEIRNLLRSRDQIELMLSEQAEYLRNVLNQFVLAKQAQRKSARNHSLNAARVASCLQQIRIAHDELSTTFLAHHANKISIERALGVLKVDRLGRHQAASKVNSSPNLQREQQSIKTNTIPAAPVKPNERVAETSKRGQAIEIPTRLHGEINDVRTSEYHEESEVSPEDRIRVKQRVANLLSSVGYEN